MGRSLDIETFGFRKSMEFFKKILKWAGHSILRPFLEKHRVFLRMFLDG
jgi:hypothetical protein